MPLTVTDVLSIADLGLTDEMMHAALQVALGARPAAPGLAGLNAFNQIVADEIAERAVSHYLRQRGLWAETWPGQAQHLCVGAPGQPARTLCAVAACTAPLMDLPTLLAGGQTTFRADAAATVCIQVAFCPAYPAPRLTLPSLETGYLIGWAVANPKASPDTDSDSSSSETLNAATLPLGQLSALTALPDALTELNHECAEYGR